MHSLGSCKTNHRERSKRKNSTNQFIANNFRVRSRASTQGKSMFRYYFLRGRKRTKAYPGFHLKWSLSQGGGGGGKRGHRDREGLSAGTDATEETKESNNRVLLGFYCLVVLFLLLYVIRASVPTEGTADKKREYFVPSSHMDFHVLSRLNGDGTFYSLRYAWLICPWNHVKRVKYRKCWAITRQNEGLCYRLLAPCHGIQQRLGLWIPRRGFRIPGIGSQLCQWNLDSGPSCSKANKR